jgi:hypothetical protein
VPWPADRLDVDGSQDMSTKAFTERYTGLVQRLSLLLLQVRPRPAAAQCPGLRCSHKRGLAAAEPPTLTTVLLAAVCCHRRLMTA